MCMSVCVWRWGGGDVVRFQVPCYNLLHRPRVVLRTVEYMLDLVTSLRLKIHGSHQDGNGAFDDHARVLTPCRWVGGLGLAIGLHINRDLPST